MHPLQSPLILVVDAEPSVLHEVTLVVAARGMRAHGCQTAQEASAFAAANPPDLILSNVNLDGHSGLELCERIKRRKSCADIEFMFLSAAQIPDIIRRSHATGASYYLRTPFDPDVLLELIDRVLPREKRPLPGITPHLPTSRPEGLPSVAP